MKNTDTLISEIEKLKKRLTCYHFVMSKIVTGIIMTDENAIIIEYNKAISELENISEEDAVGKSTPQLYFTTINEQKIKSRFLITMETKKPILNDYTKYVTSGGNIVRVVQNYYPIFHESEIVGSCCIIDEVEKLENVIDEIKKIKNQAMSESSGDREAMGKIVGISSKIQRAINEGLKVARSNVDVLVIGETGTGKELMVRMIHDNSNRKDSPFIPINCATIPENLLESILFGTQKGAFTDSQNTAGLFELAKDGTIFLDELNSMSPACQSKLLRAIQEKKIRKVGGGKEIEISCRIIGAINQEPWEAIERGFLRKDLFYRLSIACISMPPLRERPEDLRPLIDYFISVNNKKYGKSVKDIEQNLYNAFYSYPWRGNIRELKNLMESMFILCCNEKTLSEKHIPQVYLEKFKEDSIRHIINSGENTINKENSNMEMEVIPSSVKIVSLKNAVDNYEKKLLLETSMICKSTYDMAKALNVDQSTIVRKLQKYNITLK